MHSRSDTDRMLLSPDAQGVVSHPLPASLPLSRRSTSFPLLDQHIVQPEVTRDEMIRGRRVVAMPARPPHADAQARLAFLIAAHVRKGCTTATELLTHVLEGSDFAMDVCVRKDGIDPETGERYLEELGFEVINEQKMRNITEKAEDLTKRGVRRVIGIFVKTGQVCEWSKAEGKFVAMNKDELFEDPMLVRPIPVPALLDQAFGEDEAARALIAKGTASIVSLRQDAEQKGLDEGLKKGLDEGHKKGLDEGLKKGLKKGLDEGLKKGLDEGLKKGLDEGLKKGLDEGQANERRLMLIELLGERFGELPMGVEERIRAANIGQLRQWSKKVLAVESLDDVFV